MSCTFESQLHAYHDNELDASSRAAFESHLATCGACAASLKQLQSTTALFAAASWPRLSQIGRQRLSYHIDAAMERGLVRFAWSLSGIAAAVLICGSVWLSQTKTRDTQQAQAAPPWVEAAVSSRSQGDVTVTPAAQWYLADASTRSEDVP